MNVNGICKIRLYVIISTIITKLISLMGLYGCETWSLTLRGEHRLRVFENRVPRRIFGPKKDEVTGSGMKLHAEELHNLYSSPISTIKSRRMRWAGLVARIWRTRMRRRRIRMYTRLGWKTEKERNHCEDIDIGGSILRWILER
jgi:hypothetical protein